MNGEHKNIFFLGHRLIQIKRSNKAIIDNILCPSAQFAAILYY